MSRSAEVGPLCTIRVCPTVKIVSMSRAETAGREEDVGDHIPITARKIRYYKE